MSEESILKRNTARYSSAVGAALRISVCEKPLSTTTCANVVKTVSTAIMPISIGIIALATTMLTTACNKAEPIFSATLHATPDVTLLVNCVLSAIQKLLKKMS